MNLDAFYSENSISSWKTVLGDDMHYHYGGTGKDPRRQVVLDVMKFFPPEAKVLDCGCGWGGPARVFIEHGHSVTGVTISKQQADFIQDFPVIHADLEEFVPKEEYDVAVFIESYFHLSNPEKVFDSLVPFVKHIVVLDVVAPKVVDIPAFGICIKPKEYLMGALHKVGYVVESVQERADFYLDTINTWESNIKKLPSEEVTGQIALLYEICKQKGFASEIFEDPRQILLHAKRR